MAGGAIGLKDSPTVRQHRRIALRLFQRPHSGEDPQGLRVEGIAAPLHDAVVVDREIRRRRCPHCETLARGSTVIAGEAAAPLGGTGVGVEVGVAAAHGTPVEDALIIRVCLQNIPSSGIVWRGPVPKIQVTPSASPSGWHDPQLLQASFDSCP